MTDRSWRGRASFGGRNGWRGQERRGEERGIVEGRGGEGSGEGRWPMRGFSCGWTGGHLAVNLTGCQSAAVSGCRHHISLSPPRLLICHAAFPPGAPALRHLIPHTHTHTSLLLTHTQSPHRHTHTIPSHTQTFHSNLNSYELNTLIHAFP